MEKFRPRKHEKDVITVRLPVSVIQELDQKSAEADISRNELINQCILFALANMEETGEAEP